MGGDRALGVGWRWLDVVRGVRVGEVLGDDTWRASGSGRRETADGERGPSMAVSKLRLSLLSESECTDCEESTGRNCRVGSGGSTSGGRVGRGGLSAACMVARVGSSVTRACSLRRRRSWWSRLSSESIAILLRTRRAWAVCCMYCCSAIWGGAGWLHACSASARSSAHRWCVGLAGKVTAGSGRLTGPLSGRSRSMCAS